MGQRELARLRCGQGQGRFETGRAGAGLERQGAAEGRGLRVQRRVAHKGALDAMAVHEGQELGGCEADVPLGLGR